MTSNLSWRPRHAAGKDLPDDLKFALRKRHADAHLEGQVYDRDDIPYLTGLAHGGVKGAQKLIDAIEKHDEIELMERS